MEKSEENLQREEIKDSEALQNQKLSPETAIFEKQKENLKTDSKILENLQENLKPMALNDKKNYRKPKEFRGRKRSLR